MKNKPSSPACERNREPILEVLKNYLPGRKNLLELGSGTGQHAVYFAPELPNLNWVTSDVKENHPGIKGWLEEFGSRNISGPVEYEVGKDPFPEGKFDSFFTANTFHIMSFDLVQQLIEDLGKNLEPKSLALIYGPFNYEGAYTSESNAQFDQRLKERDSRSGIRDFEEIRSEMETAGFSLLRDHPMPANNRLLTFSRETF